MSGSVRKKLLSFELRTKAAEPGKRIFCQFPIAEHSIYIVGTLPLYEKKRKETYNSNFAMPLENNNAIN